MRTTVRRIAAWNTFMPEAEAVLADGELVVAPVDVPVDVAVLVDVLVDEAEPPPDVAFCHRCTMKSDASVR